MLLYSFTSFIESNKSIAYENSTSLKVDVPANLEIKNTPNTGKKA